MTHKTVVITGSTRGIGFGMAREFLARGHRVVITGRSQSSVDKAVADLGGSGADVFGQPCDVRSLDEVQALWDTAVERFGRVDIWINNAGVATPRRRLHELHPESIAATVDTNITGSLWGASVAITGMLAQGGGDVYMFEGFGSNDMTQSGISVYGTTKRGLTYLTASLAKEYADTPVRIGSLSPGIVITDLMLDTSRLEDTERWERAKRLLNVLADKVETVTPWLVEQTLANDRNGAKIRWLTRGKTIARFLNPKYRKRDLFAGTNA